MSEEYTIEELARMAFEAYGISTGGLTWDKKPIPPWGELPEHVQAAWTAAAQAIFDAVTGTDAGNDIAF